jgi:protein O-GlcNAc transferase
MYFEAFAERDIDLKRFRIFKRTATEETHRLIYTMVDVMLDSYPYNGGSHTVEALWFNLPVVTRVGQQFLSRMGYSFVKNAGLDEGVAWNFDEYVDWGTRLGLDANLRRSVVEKLKQGKTRDPKAPLFDPPKLARDLYALLETLVMK